VRNQDVAEEKDTGSAPDTGQTESGSASPETPDELARELEELDALDEREDDDGSDGDRELVSVGAAAKAGKTSGGTSRTVSRTETGRGKKNRATPKQRAAEDHEKRVGPIGFVKGSISELKKVVYPTAPQLGNYFVVVLIFVMLVIAIVAGLDYGFGWLVLKVFGGS
jgi:preprotein translocase subunit SecE